MLLMGTGKANQRLLKSICWVPVKRYVLLVLKLLLVRGLYINRFNPILLDGFCRFKPSMMKLATFSWEWLVMGSPEMMVELVAELADAWIHTLQQKQGMFCASGCDTGRFPPRRVVI